MTPTELPAKPRHPKGLAVLFFTEMWERFSYYLMIGIFMQFLIDSQTGGMGWDGAKAASVVGTYLAGVYVTPFLGGILGDRLLGYRTCVALGGAFMGLGHVLLALPGELFLYLALLSLVIGNGLFKSNMATLVGRLYPQGSPLKDQGYTIFYMGVNLGAFICNFVAAVVRNAWGWHAAFGTAGVGMAIGIVTFLAFQRHVRHADITREERAARPKEPIGPLFTTCLIPAAILAIAGYSFVKLGVPPFSTLWKDATDAAFLLACIPIVIFYLRLWRSLKDRGERGRVSAMLAIFAVVIVFWTVFKQNSTALTAWGVTNTDREPGELLKPVIGVAPQFAEAAPPEYFYNAGPDTPRPDPTASFAIVPEADYARLEEAGELTVEQGQPTPVTEEIHAKVFANATAATPTLPPGEQLGLLNTELLQSINPAFVILLSPLMVGLWSVLNRRRKEPSIPAKIGLGLLITGLSALVMVGAAQALEASGTKVSAWWLFSTYGVITVGELCLSPIGLSMVSKMAPVRMAAFLMGGWHLSTAIGNKLSGMAGKLYFKMDHTVFFTLNAVICVAAAGAIVLMLPWLKRQFGTLDGPKESREVSAEVVPTGRGAQA